MSVFQRVSLNVGIVSLFIYVLTSGSTAGKCGWLVVTAATIIFFAFEGGRRLIVELILSLLIVRHYIGGRLSIRRALSTGAVLFIAVAILDVIRSTMHHGFWQFKRTILNADKVLLLRMNTEYNSLFDVMISVVEKVPEKMNFLYGKSFIKPVFALIPRSVWPDKPISISEQLAQFLYPYQAGFSIGTSIVGEAYMNFGYPAIVAVMLLFGVAVRAVYAYFQQYPGNRSAVLLYACVFPLFFEFYRGPFSSVAILLVMQVFFLLPLIGLFRETG